MSEQYAKPPITEALIEARFKPSLSEKVLRRLIKRVSARYVRTEEQVEVEFSLQVGGTTQNINQQFSGARCFGHDGAELLTLSKSSVIVHRLAPYTGWDALRHRLELEVEDLRKIAADRRFTRMGVRYINRIDVPEVDGMFSPEPHITLFPARPEILSEAPAQGFTVALAGCLVGGYRTNVNTGIMPSQLIGHGALLVDVDVIFEGDMDVRELFEKIDGARIVKNSVFEDLITDQARALFREQPVA